MTTTHSAFLKEMGISEWVSRDAAQTSLAVSAAVISQSVSPEAPINDRENRGIWWFYGNEPQGDAKILFHNIIRVLGLAKSEWSWNNGDNLTQVPSADLPVVAIAFGEPIAQKITGERDALPQLRETVLALNTGNEEEIPVIATFELNQVLSRPKEKALLWQDFLLAKSVLQNS